MIHVWIWNALQFLLAFEGGDEGIYILRLVGLVSCYPLVDALFSEVNPIPVKAALAKMGICSDETRLPLTKMSVDKRKMLYSILEELPDIR